MIMQESQSESEGMRELWDMESDFLNERTFDYRSQNRIDSMTTLDVECLFILL